MQIINFADPTQAITQFNSHAAYAQHLAAGTGEAHIYCVRFETGGSIGPHPTGYGQLFVVLEGSGWVSGPDDVRVPLGAGQAAYFERGTRHSKGSDAGMTALMIQVVDLAPVPD